jgi:dTDP-4-amino-4,6-dideoxygalactose transaminase
MKTIPTSWPYISKSEILSARKVLNEGWLGLGSYVEKFEKKLSNYLNLKNRFICCVSTGTDALLMSLFAAKVKRGDEVILPSLNFLACAQSILICGAKPVFCDVDEKTLCIDVEKLKKLINKKTKAVIAVDYSGNIADYKKLNILKKKFKFKIIQDAAHSFGSVYENKKVGNFSDITIFSFDPIKTITTIDGGAIVVKSLKDLEYLKSIRQLGYSVQPNVAFRNKKKLAYDVKNLGFQNRMSNVHAAIGLAQIDKISSIISKKRNLCKNYNYLFNKIDKVITPFSTYEKVTPFIYYIRVKKKYRDRLRSYLRKKNIFTGLHWYPNHKLTLFNKCKKGDLSVTNKVSSELITLPLFHKLEKKEQKYIFNQVQNFFKNEK